MFVSLEATVVFIFIVINEGTTISLSLGDLVFKNQVNSLLIRSLRTTGADAMCQLPDEHLSHRSSFHQHSHAEGRPCYFHLTDDNAEAEM